MTGIERLRDVACKKTVMLTALLREIADQIERETLPRPLFEDGEVVQRGDMAMFGNKLREVVDYQMNDCVVTFHTYGDYWSMLPGQRLKRPEKCPDVDSWERIEQDVAKGEACRYFGVSDEDRQECRECENCAARPLAIGCGEAMAADVLRRCKALAGIEDEQMGDSWERIEEDVDTGYGFVSMDKAEACADVLRRAKKLAGVE